MQRESPPPRLREVAPAVGIFRGAGVAARQGAVQASRGSVPVGGRIRRRAGRDARGPGSRARPPALAGSAKARAGPGQDHGRHGLGRPPPARWRGGWSGSWSGGPSARSSAHGLDGPRRFRSGGDGGALARSRAAPQGRRGRACRGGRPVRFARRTSRAAEPVGQLAVHRRPREPGRRAVRSPGAGASRTRGSNRRASWSPPANLPRPSSFSTNFTPRSRPTPTPPTCWRRSISISAGGRRGWARRRPPFDRIPSSRPTATSSVASFAHSPAIAATSGRRPFCAAWAPRRSRSSRRRPGGMRIRAFASERRSSWTEAAAGRAGAAADAKPARACSNGNSQSFGTV